ncbi:MAG: hypothetical protein RLZZ28_415 [Bacteroidota bacterium]|jgi:ribosomal protein S18 acetylase RimI-like enzyme
MQFPSHIDFAVIEDIPALNKLVNSAYRGESSKKGWTTEESLLDGLRTDPQSLQALITDPGSVILKYTSPDNQILACVYLKLKKDRLYLGMLTVSPELQGKGIGKILLQAAEKYAILKKCSAIEMTVISVRFELIAWYTRHGYQPTGATEPFPTDPKFGIAKQPLEFIVLEKPIVLPAELP